MTENFITDPQTQQALRVGDFARLMSLTAKPGEILMTKCTNDMFKLMKEIKFDHLFATSMGMPIIWMLSEYYRISISYVGLVPEAPTGDFPFCVVSPVSLGSAEKNLASYDMVYNASFKGSEINTNKQREELGLKKLKGAGWLSLKEQLNMPIIYAFSKSIFGGIPSNYRKNVNLCGYFELKLESDTLGQNIEDFLSLPMEAPCFLSFGSMPALDPFQLFELSEAVLNSNCRVRVILACGKWSLHIKQVSQIQKDGLTWIR